MSTTTSYTHMGLMSETGMCYRIFGINVVATSTSFVGYGDAYVTTNDNDAIATTDPAPPNTAPMAVGTIAAVTVMAGQMSEMDVSGYFSDADTGDTLTYTAMSDMTSYATVSVSGSMVTINGVAAGTAIITVTATDTADAMVTQTIRVTVEAAVVPMFSAPTEVAATSAGGAITVTWMPGDLAASQVIIAVNAVDDTDYCLHVDTSGVLAEHECPNLTAGQIYVVLIIALDGQGGYELGNVVSHTAS